MGAGVSYGFTQDQHDTLQVSATVCGLISLIAVSYCMFDMYMKYRAGNRGFTLQMQLVLMGFNFATGFAGTFGEVAQLFPFFCLFQGFVMQFAALGTLLWSNVIAWNMYQWIVYNRRLETIKSNLARDASIVGFISFLPAICLVGTDDYRAAGPWCWIAKSHPAQRYGLLFVPLLVSYVHCVATVWYIRKIMSDNSRTGEKGAKLNPNDQLVFNQLAGIVLVYLVAYFFPLVNRTIEAATDGGHIFAFEVFQTISVLLQGFVNALIYKGAIVYLSQKTSDSGNSVKFRVVPTRELTACKDACPFTTVKEEDLAEYSVFTSTYNMGEAPINEVVPFFDAWLMRGHDIYCINVQECMEFEALKEAIVAHMGGPELYFSWSDAIGSDIKAAGYHGFIGLIVLISQDHVKTGAVRINACASPKVATGTNLGFATAENKGAVGIPLQINELSVVFLGSHLPSDEKGKNKVHLRNTASHNILNELNALSENAGFSLEYEHHAVFFLGDLNYRMTEDLFNHAAYNSALIKVARAAAVESKELASRGTEAARQMNWLQRRYHLLRHASDPQHPTSEEATLLNEARKVANPLWAAVTQGPDELLQAMASGAAFATWQEHPITFPPTYKKFTGPPRAGPNGELGVFPDYMDPVAAQETYSHYSKFDIGDNGADGLRDTDMDNIRNSQRYSSTFVDPPKSLNDVEGELTAQGKMAPRRGTSLGGMDDSISGSERDRRDTIVTSSNKSMGGGQGQSIEKFKKKRRNPSYCDRILNHAHVDVRNAKRVEWKTYDMADTVTCSDHRPVSGIINIKANKHLLFPRNFADRRDENSLHKERKGSIQLTKEQASNLSKKGGKGAGAISVLDIRRGGSAPGQASNDEVDETTIIGTRLFLYELEIEDFEVAMEVYLDNRIEKFQLDQRRKHDDSGDLTTASSPMHGSNPNPEGSPGSYLDQAEKGIVVGEEEDDDEIPPNTRKWKQDNKYRQEYRHVTHICVALGLPSCNPLFKEQHNNMRLVDLLNIDEFSMTTLLSPNMESVALQNLYDSVIGPKLSTKRNRASASARGGSEGETDGKNSEDGEEGRGTRADGSSIGGRMAKRVSQIAGANMNSFVDIADVEVIPHSLLKPSFMVTMDITNEMPPLGSPPNSPKRMSTLQDGTILHRPSFQSSGNQDYTQSLSAAPRVGYKASKKRQRMVGCINPCMGAHVVVKFLHGNSEEDKLGECCISLTHLMEKSAIRSVDAVLRGASRTVTETDVNSPLVDIDDIPVTLGGLFCGSARGKFALRFLGAAEREGA